MTWGGGTKKVTYDGGGGGGGGGGGFKNCIFWNSAVIDNIMYRLN